MPALAQAVLQMPNGELLTCIEAVRLHSIFKLYTKSHRLPSLNRELPVCVLSRRDQTTRRAHQGMPRRSCDPRSAPADVFAPQPSQTRHFVSAPAPPPEALAPPRAPSPAPSKQKGKKRARAPRKTPAPSQKAKQRKTKGKQRAQESDEEDVIDISSDEDDRPVAQAPEPSSTAPRRSARARKVKAGGYREQDEDSEEEVQEIHQVHDVDADVNIEGPSEDAQTGPEQDRATVALQLDDSNLIAMDESEETPAPQPSVKRETIEPSVSLTGDPEPVEEVIAEQVIETTGSAQEDAQPMLQDEEEEDKKKLTLRLRYEGFNIQGRHLCVVVEPYPPIRAQTRAPSLAPIFANPQRAPSIAPADYVPRGATPIREKTPLFLPEYDRERSVTPAPSFARRRHLPPVPLFNESQEDEDSDDGGFMEFTQILRSVSQNHAGAAEEDDEIDGAVLFGDADETREL